MEFLDVFQPCQKPTTPTLFLPLSTTHPKNKPNNNEKQRTQQIKWQSQRKTLAVSQKNPI